MIDGRFDPYFAEIFVASRQADDPEDQVVLRAALAFASFLAVMAVLCLTVAR